MPGVDRVREPAWSVTDGGSLTFVHTPVLGAFGTIAPPAAVRLVP
jgi:hypothetical protein